MAPLLVRDLDVLIVRLAAAYEEPGLLRFHLDDVGRAARLADPALRVSTRDVVLTAGELPVRVRHRVDAAPPRPGRTPAARRRSGVPDENVLRVGTGRRSPTEEESAELGDLATKLPFVLG